MELFSWLKWPVLRALGLADEYLIYVLLSLAAIALYVVFKRKK